MWEKLTKKNWKKSIAKDVAIVAIGVLIIWVSMWAYFGTNNPFYVVASGSMLPELQVYDVLIVQAHIPFEDIQIGDIIVFDRPSGHDRVIVHRVVSITDDDPRTIRTKGDNNVASIPGTDFPITEKEYIGKVVNKIPQIGYVTQILKPPINYILIVIVIGFMIVKEMIKRKNEKELALGDPLKSTDPGTLEDFSDLTALEKDKAYSEHSKGMKNKEESFSNSQKDSEEKK